MNEVQQPARLNRHERRRLMSLARKDPKLKAQLDERLKAQQQEMPLAQIVIDIMPPAPDSNSSKLQIHDGLQDPLQCARVLVDALHTVLNHAHAAREASRPPKPMIADGEATRLLLANG